MLQTGARFGVGLCLATGVASLASGQPARAQDASPPAPEDMAVHAQATFVAQGVTGFRSPYVGPNSLTPRQVRETVDLTLYAGVKPWSGAELWINPEVDQGFGISNTLGVAGFPSAEAYKVGKADPYIRLQRLFLRQTVALGGDASPVAAAANQLAGTQRADRLVLTVGKFGVGDVFDTNRYAHDPRGDFLNWAIVDAGTFDYAADAWGYSLGAAAEWYRRDWTLRLGAFNLSKIPNGETLERDFSQNQLVVELEHRHSIGGHAGAIRVTFFRNHGRFARYDDAVAFATANGGTPDLDNVRGEASRIGAHVNVEQEITGTLGVFGRAGLVDGAIETYDFTDVDRTAALGLSLAGKGWHREHDHVGVALDVNGISSDFRRYLAAGGLGVLIGDGQLPHPGAEAIGEVYYDWQPVDHVDLSLDYQRIENPGYNRDRGPANVFGVRLHGAF